MDNFTITWKDQATTEAEGKVSEIRYDDTHIQLIKGEVHKEVREHPYYSREVKTFPFKQWVIPWSEVTYFSTS